MAPVPDLKRDAMVSKGDAGVQKHVGMTSEMAASINSWADLLGPDPECPTAPWLALHWHTTTYRSDLGNKKHTPEYRTTRATKEDEAVRLSRATRACERRQGPQRSISARDSRAPAFACITVQTVSPEPPGRPAWHIQEEHQHAQPTGLRCETATARDCDMDMQQEQDLRIEGLGGAPFRDSSCELHGHHGSSRTRLDAPQARGDARARKAGHARLRAAGRVCGVALARRPPARRAASCHRPRPPLELPTRPQPRI